MTGTPGVYSQVFCHPNWTHACKDIDRDIRTTTATPLPPPSPSLPSPPSSLLFSPSLPPPLRAAEILIFRVVGVGRSVGRSVVVVVQTS